MSEQKNVTEQHQPVEEEKKAVETTTVALPATVDEMATKVSFWLQSYTAEREHLADTLLLCVFVAPAAEPVGPLVRQPEEAPLDRVLGGEPQERLHVQHGGGLLVVRSNCLARLSLPLAGGVCVEGAHRMQN
jgi:hypothetical protein